MFSLGIRSFIALKGYKSNTGKFLKLIVWLLWSATVLKHLSIIEGETEFAWADSPATAFADA